MNKRAARERAERFDFYIEEDLTQADAWITRDHFTQIRVTATYKTVDHVAKWIEREEKRAETGLREDKVTVRRRSKE